MSAVLARFCKRVVEEASAVGIELKGVTTAGFSKTYAKNNHSAMKWQLRTGNGFVLVSHIAVRDLVSEPLKFRRTSMYILVYAGKMPTFATQVKKTQGALDTFPRRLDGLIEELKQGGDIREALIEITSILKQTIKSKL